MASSVHIYHVALAFAFSQYAHVLFFFYLDGHEKPEQQARRKTYIAQINEVWPRVVKTYDAGGDACGYAISRRVDVLQVGLVHAFIACCVHADILRFTCPLYALHFSCVICSHDYFRNHKWGKEGVPKVGMRAKSKGSAIMVSGWVSLALGFHFWQLHEHGTQV